MQPRPSPARTGRSARATAVLGAVVLVAAAACTPGADADERTPEPRAAVATEGAGTPSAPDAPRAAVTRAPRTATTVGEADDAVGRAVAMSRTLFASAPVVVLAADGDDAGLLTGASAAVALGAPVLVTDGTPTVDDVVRREVERLGAEVVLTAGAAVAPEGPATVAAPDGPALERLLGTRLERVEVDVARPVRPVATLERDARSLLVPAGATSGPPADDTAPGTPTGGATPSGRTEGPAPSDGAGGSAPSDGADGSAPSDREAGATSTDEGTGPTPSDAGTGATPTALPRLGPTEPVAGVLVLTAGDVRDVAAVATARAAGAEVLPLADPDPRRSPAAVARLAASDHTTTVGTGPELGGAADLGWKVATAATGVELPGGGQVLFPGRRMVALYGTPTTTALGVLGEQGVAGSVERARGLARQYQRHTDDVVVPAFEIIVTVASGSAGKDRNYSNELPVESFVPWVEAARDAGLYVVLDLQPGRTDFLTQAKRYERLLRYPNVGLALDPEWRLEKDQVHLRQIGSVDAAEVNRVVDWLADLTRREALPQKLLVLHQFSPSMIDHRERLDTSREELAVMIHADGQGSQPAKQGTWHALRRGAPDGVWWGWKNFVDEDEPMLSVTQTYRRVRPVPHLVTYQ